MDVEDDDVEEEPVVFVVVIDAELPLTLLVVETFDIEVEVPVNDPVDPLDEPLESPVPELVTLELDDPP